MSPRKHYFAVAAAYVSWGLLPLYWKLFDAVPPEVVVAHRAIWSSVFLAVVLAWKGEAVASLQRLGSLRVLRRALPSAFLLGANWLVYLWAIAQHRIVEASLGYFICPLITVALGAFLLGEKLAQAQRFAIALIGAGVLAQIVLSGSFPVFALALALSFSLYALGRKRNRVSPIEGLYWETVLLAIPALASLILAACSGIPVFGGSAREFALLASTGPMTALPMLLFAWGLERASLKFAGIAQYLAPTIKLLLATFVLGEPLHQGALVGYVLVWCGIAVYLLGDLVGPIALRTLAGLRSAGRESRSTRVRVSL